MARDDGLSTASFLGGAMKGYQFVEGEKDRKRQRGLQDERMDMRAQQFGMEKERHEATMEAQEQQTELRGLKMDQINDENVQRMNQIVAMTLASADAAGLPEEDQQLLAAHPNLNAQRILSPEFGRAIEVAEGVFEGEIDRNSPEAMEALEMLAPEIQLGATGGRKVHPQRIVPGTEEGKFMVDLSVEGQEGHYPITDRRSSDDDDPVKQFDIDQLAGRIQAAKQYREILSDPKGRQAFMNTYLPEDMRGEQKAGEPYEHPQLGWVQEQPDGTLKQYDPADGGVGGGSSKEPADIQTARILRDELANEGTELSFEQAWSLAKTAVSDPTRYVADYVKVRMDAQEFAPEDERKTPEQLEQEAMASYKRIRQMDQQRPSGRQGGGQGGNRGARAPDTRQMLNELSGGRGSDVPIPRRPRRQAPPAAEEYLRNNPDTAGLFQKTYGYLPEGFQPNQ